MNSITLSGEPIAIGTPAFEALVERYVKYHDALPEAFPDHAPLPLAYMPAYPAAWLFAYRSWFDSRDPEALSAGAYDAGGMSPPSPYRSA